MGKDRFLVLLYAWKWIYRVHRDNSIETRGAYSRERCPARCIDLRKFWSQILVFGAEQRANVTMKPSIRVSLGLK